MERSRPKASDTGTVRALTNGVRSAMKIRDNAKASLAEKHRTRRLLDSRAADAQRSADKIKDEIFSAAEKAAMDGVPLPPLGDHEAKLRAALLESTACKGAMPQADAAVEAARREVVERERTLADAVIASTCREEYEAIAPIHAALQAVLDPLAALAAPQVIRSRLLGPRYVFDATRHAPIGGLVISEALINAIPERLRPDGLDASAVQDRANEIAERLIANFQSKEK